MALLGADDDLTRALAAELATHGIQTESDANADVEALLFVAPDRADDDIVAPYLDALAALQAFRGGRPHGGAVVAVTRLGGDFGIAGPAFARARLGGFSAMVKTIAHEWPDVGCKAIDVDPDEQVEVLARRIVAECRTDAGAREVALAPNGSRSVAGEREMPLASPFRVFAEPPVVLVTGGARGILPACLGALARAVPGIRLGLVGRSPAPHADPVPAGIAPAQFVMANAEREGRTLTPLQLGAEVKRLAAASEIRATLRDLEAAGADVAYVAADVADAAALVAAVAEIRARFGRIDAIVHGAGVLADRLVVDQRPEQFRTVVAAKVQGLETLLAATAEDEIGTILLFTSVAARYGNPGQVAYAAANEALNVIARAEAARRGSECTVRALNWGPWDGGMVGDGLKRLFEERGVPVIPLAVGAEAFAAEFLAEPGTVDADIVLAMAPART